MREKHAAAIRPHASAHVLAHARCDVFSPRIPWQRRGQEGRTALRNLLSAIRRRKTMKVALFYGGPDIRVAELPTPEPGNGEVLVRIQSAGICGSDLHRYRGAG